MKKLLEEPRESLWQQLLRAEDTEAITLLAVFGALALALLVLAVYLLLLLPRKRRRPLRKALAIIQHQDLDNFPRAEELLTAALVAGMRRRDIAEARFALAYVRARLGRYFEAAGVLADLIASGNREPAVLYLDLWLQSYLKDHDKVEQIYFENRDALEEFPDTKLIVGIAFLHKARQHWSQKQVESALHYFAELRKLGVLTEEIPSHIDYHQVVLGIMALFDKKIEEARQHFRGAENAAQGDNKSPVPAQLGLLLCDWRAADNPDIDERLGQALAAMPVADKFLTPEDLPETPIALCPFCGKKYKFNRELLGKNAKCKECKKVFPLEIEPSAKPSADAPGMAQPNLDKESLLLRNALLWHAISLLFAWRKLPGKKGLPVPEFKKMKDRLHRIRRVDADMGDSYLMEGLLAYYFAGTDDDRTLALKILEKATKSDVNVPEVLNLVLCEQKLAHLRKNSVQLFLELLKSYLTDAGVPEHLRRELQERLAPFSAFKMGPIELAKGEDEAAPSVQDLQNRGALIHRRVTTIVKPRLAHANADPKDKETINTLMKSLEAATKTLVENAKGLESAELKLLETTGEFLFEEEEQAKPPISPPQKKEVIKAPRAKKGGP
jgi:tetratricopeptide (TPR) repeat protein